MSTIHQKEIVPLRKSLRLISAYCPVCGIMCEVIYDEINKRTFYNVRRCEHIKRVRYVKRPFEYSPKDGIELWFKE